MITVALTVTRAIPGAVCPLALIVLLIGFLWAVGAAVREGVPWLRRLHSIPCDRCIYFTGCHHLKCTVHPCQALTEAAINCRDFEPAAHRRSYASNRCKP